MRRGDPVAGTHIPEPVVMGPQHKRVYARPWPGLKGVYARLRGLWTGVNALEDALCAGTTASYDHRSSTSRSLLQPAQQIMTLVFEACSSSVRMASRCSGVPEITRCSQAPQMPSSQE